MGEKMEKMKFRGHETFFIRKGWLNKGIRNILKDPYVFMGKNPSDILGLGTNMVKSLRYWLQAVGLTREKMAGKKIAVFSPFRSVFAEQCMEAMPFSGR